jgi:DNA-binding MarR family transcriptional regulator
LREYIVSCNDIIMMTKQEKANSHLLLETLAEFRYELRQFLHFSECAAVEVGLQPQQHQLLLQVAGAPEGEIVTIAYAAKRLSLRHHSVVELVNRSEREGLLARTVDTVDKRRAILQTTHKGELVLDRLAADHAREIDELAPRLVKALKRIGRHAQDSAGVRAQ